MSIAKRVTGYLTAKALLSCPPHLNVPLAAPCDMNNIPVDDYNNNNSDRTKDKTIYSIVFISHRISLK